MNLQNINIPFCLDALGEIHPVVLNQKLDVSSKGLSIQLFQQTKKSKFDEISHMELSTANYLQSLFFSSRKYSIFFFSYS